MENKDNLPSTLGEASIHHSVTAPAHFTHADSFVAGGNWQREQFNPLIEEIKITIRYLDSIGATQYASDLKNKLEQLG